MSIIPVLIQGFIEQQTIIETQSAEIDKFKDDFKLLEKEIIKNSKQELNWLKLEVVVDISDLLLPIVYWEQ